MSIYILFCLDRLEEVSVKIFLLRQESNGTREQQKYNARKITLHFLSLLAGIFDILITIAFTFPVYLKVSEESKFNNFQSYRVCLINRKT